MNHAGIVHLSLTPALCNFLRANLAAAYRHHWESCDLHHSNTLVLGDALQLAYIGKKKRGRHPEATIGQFVSPLAWPCLTQGFSRQHSEIFVQPSRLTVDVLDNNAYCLTFFHATWKTNIVAVIN